MIFLSLLVAIKFKDGGEVLTKCVGSCEANKFRLRCRGKDHLLCFCLPVHDDAVDFADDSAGALPCFNLATKVSIAANCNCHLMSLVDKALWCWEVVRLQDAVVDVIRVHEVIHCAIQVRWLSAGG